MSDTIEKKGSCLCGANRFSATSTNKNVGACHCDTCRKWGGGAFMTADCGTDVLFENKDKISVFSSSDWAERGFCAQCGSHLFYRLKANQQYFMPLGLFDDDKLFVFDHQVFIDEKPSFYCFANKTKDLTGAEVFAQFASESE